MSIIDISSRPRRELVKLVSELTGNTIEEIDSLSDTDLNTVAAVYALHGLKKLTIDGRHS